MKKKIKEKHKLPLTFKYMEPFRKQKNKRSKREDTIYFVPSEKYNTDFLVRERPVKSLIRML
ncbi:transcription elongation factor [Flavobacterium arsenatis]|uniref:Transcription elongation factor n=1 Tax=Flavobacterium arsenatis TaxID=1484332 RepID=A0ABU1TQG0_9FLAO|nr:transcription elongation factor [Flavobacterium arsenatis]